MEHIFPHRQKLQKMEISELFTMVQSSFRKRFSFFFSVIWKGPIKLTPEAEKIIIQKLTFIRRKEFLSFFLFLLSQILFKHSLSFYWKLCLREKLEQKFGSNSRLKKIFYFGVAKVYRLLAFQKVRFLKCNFNWKF